MAMSEGLSEHPGLPTMGEAIHVGAAGEVELVTRDAAMSPGRYSFATLDDLVAHLSQEFGVAPQNGGISGSMSRKGTYARRSADGAPAATFGDVVLDAIASPQGNMEIGGLTIDLGEGHGTAGAGGDGIVAFDATYLKFTGMVNGAERWASDDGEMVEFRIGGDYLNFHAWKRSTFYKYWSMGGEIGVWGPEPTQYEAADVICRTYMEVNSPACLLFEHPDAFEPNGTYLDKYDWGWNSPQPNRVAVLLRAQWHNALFSEVLTAGGGCDTYLNDPWPTELPPGWPVNTGVTVHPLAVGMHVHGFGNTMQAPVTAVNHDPHPTTIRIDPVKNPDQWSHPVGDFSIPAFGEYAIPVEFEGAEHAGLFSSSIRIVAGGQGYVIPISATVSYMDPDL